MHKRSYFCALAVIAGCFFSLRAAPVAAQSAGNVEFVARVEPAGGDPEPVRQLTFYLLRKSVADIRQESLQAEPFTNVDQFIDTLSFTPQLKAWMHKHHTARLTGEEFIKSVTADDVVDIPEFFKAYMTHNEAFRGMGFPEPKFKEKDKTANPEKYKDQKDMYEAAVRKYIGANMTTIQGMDLELVDANPYPRWESLERKQRQTLDARAMQLAEQRYVVARTQTDLDGHGSFAGVAPGNYWIGMLGVEAISGDVRLHWDLPVTVRPGQTASVELSNVNAARPALALNSDN